MFEIVLRQSIEDQLRSNRVAGYAILHGMTIYSTVELFYARVTKETTLDLEDTTLAVTITDLIYQTLLGE